jgi:hypothetical protein
MSAKKLKQEASLKQKMKVLAATSSFKDLILPSLLLLLLGSLMLFLKELPKRTQLPPKAQTSSPPPQRVLISNVTAKGFNVSWTTSEKTRGGIIYSQSKEEIERDETLSPRKDDERGGSYQSHVHSVRVDNLNPGGKYYFKIISGEKVFLKAFDGQWQKAGVAESIDLPDNLGFNDSQAISANNSPGSFSRENAAFSGCPKVPGEQSSTCFRPNPIYGQILKEEQTPVEEALVYLEIPAKSNRLSTLTGKEGRFTIDLANLVDKDYQNRIGYLPKVDLVKIFAHGPQNSSAIVYHQIPPVSKTYQDDTNPVLLKLNYPPQTPTPPPSTVPTATPAPTATTTPQPPTANLSLNLALQGRESGNRYANLSLYQGETKVLERKILLTGKNTNYQGSLNLYRLGNFNLTLKPEGYLARRRTVIISEGANRLELEDEFLAGDLNEDNEVNSLDVSIILGQINQGNQDLSGDFNGDGQVNNLDLAILTGNYLRKGY